MVVSDAVDRFLVDRRKLTMSEKSDDTMTQENQSTKSLDDGDKDSDSLPNGITIKEEPCDSMESPEDDKTDPKENIHDDDKDGLAEPEISNKKVKPRSIGKRKASRSSLSTRSSRSSSIGLSSDRQEEPSSTQENDTVKMDVDAENLKPQENIVYSDEDEEDFHGFEAPSTDHRNSFLKAISRENFLPEDETMSQEASSEHMSTDNPPSVDSDNYTMGEISNQGKKALRPNKKSIVTDMSNPGFRKPFEHGWVRELVYRSASETSMKRNADVYYYTPSGKKVRSCREVADYLTGDLTMENFTFFKEPIGINDSSKEIIREAKVKPGPKLAEDGTPIASAKKTSAKPKPSLTPKTPKPTTEGNSKSFTPKVVLYKNKPKLAGNKNKLDKKRKSAGPDDLDMSPEEWSPPEPKQQPSRDVCSIDCHLAMGLIPTLQCNSCLCLYHPECMGLQREKIRSSHTYICKACQAAKSSGSNNSSTNSTVSSTYLKPPPPLTPIVTITRSGTPPPLATNPVHTGLKQQSPTKKEVKTVAAPKAPPIVGTVTTWLPPSSSIQVSQNSQTPKTTSPQTVSTTTPSDAMSRQGLLTLNGSPYIFIHKQNVVNVTNPTNSGLPAIPPGTTDQPVPNLIPASPGLLPAGSGFMVSQTQAGKPHSVFLVPCPVPQDPGYSDTVSQLQIPVVNSSIQAITPVPVQPIGSASQANGVKRANSSPLEGSSPPPEKKYRVKDEQVQENTSTYLRENFMMNLNAGFTALLHAFQYLKVHELLRAICVSQMWRHIASHRSLWETVRMKNSRVRDWQGFGRALKTHNTKALDLRKMLLPESPEATTEMWMEFSEAIKDLPNLKRIDFGRCTTQAIETVTKACPQLESVVSLSIRGTDMDLSPIADCSNLVELKLKSLGGLEVKNLSALKHLKCLKVLGLTTIKSIEGIEDVLNENLENLELGDCIKLSESFAKTTLPTLVNLKRLRLEKGQMNCPTIPILNTIAKLPNLTQLELINFDIKPGFDKALAKCSNIKILLIIPTYVTQSATTNHVVMGGVSKLSHTLVYFIWGLTLELLRVTDLFIDQVEGQKGGNKAPNPSKKPGTGDSIPILKPLTEDGSEIKEGQSASQVDILGLPKLQRVLSTLLPNTKIKILKVPFSATWRQTVTDGPAQ